MREKERQTYTHTHTYTYAIYPPSHDHGVIMTMTLTSSALPLLLSRCRLHIMTDRGAWGPHQHPNQKASLPDNGSNEQATLQRPSQQPRPSCASRPEHVSRQFEHACGSHSLSETCSDQPHFCPHGLAAGYATPKSRPCQGLGQEYALRSRGVWALVPVGIAKETCNFGAMLGVLGQGEPLSCVFCSLFEGPLIARNHDFTRETNTRCDDPHTWSQSDNPSQLPKIFPSMSLDSGRLGQRGANSLMCKEELLVIIAKQVIGSRVFAAVLAKLYEVDEELLLPW